MDKNIAIEFNNVGKQYRLGLAVAAFLNPEFLVVDEVLAVCDAEFSHIRSKHKCQKKAIGKMKYV